MQKRATARSAIHECTNTLVHGSQGKYGAHSPERKKCEVEGCTKGAVQGENAKVMRQRERSVR
jgi:hypothetical protein